MDVLESLSPARGEACPSDFALSQYEAGVLAGERAASVEAHLSGCERCRGWLEEGKAAFEALPAETRRDLVDRMQAARAAAAGSVGAARSSQAARWPWLAGPLLAAAAALLFFVEPPSPERPAFTHKGSGLALRVFAERGGRVREAMAGETLREGDRLRFEIGVPAAGHVMVVGVEESGSPYRSVPSAGDASLPVDDGLVSDAIELDASTGREAFHLVYCPMAFTYDELGASTSGGLRVPRGCLTRTFGFEKIAK